MLSIEREEFWKAANSFVRLFAPLAGKMWVHVVSKKKSLRGEEKYQRESYFGALSAAMHRKVLYIWYVCGDFREFIASASPHRLGSP